MAKFALENKDSQSFWVAPSYRQTQIAFRMVSKALKNVLANPPNKSELRLELINESIIQFASTERFDNLRGDRIDLLIIDEAAQVDERAWTEGLRASLSDSQGRAIFIGTPRARNWFWRIFQRGLDPLEDEWESFTFPTSANPYIPAKEIAQAKKDLPEDVFRQEYEAVFLEESAGVFRNIDACVEGEVLDLVPGATYCIGLDVAKYEDFTVATVMNMDTCHVDYWERFHHMDYDDQIEIVKDISDRYNHASIEMDATGVGDPVTTAMQKRGLSVNGIKFTNVKKEQYVRNLVVMLQNRELTFPYLPVLIKELRQYEYHYTDERNLKYGAPEGEHDDAVTSLYLVAWRIQDKGDIPFLTTDTVEPTHLHLPIVETEDEVLQRRQAQVAASMRFIQTLGV